MLKKASMLSLARICSSSCCTYYPLNNNKLACNTTTERRIQMSLHFLLLMLLKIQHKRIPAALQQPGPMYFKTAYAISELMLLLTRLRASSSKIFLRRRILFGVTSIHSSDCIYSIHSSKLI